MKTLLLSVLILLIGLVSSLTATQTGDAKQTLNIYYIDVEGGAATLIVTPLRESILIDTGWPGFEGRDAKRIQRAMQQAGITEIDHLVLTHYHTDHYGGVAQFANLVKINHFYDHGPMSSLAEDPKFPELYAAYQAAAKGKITTLKPGDTISLRQAKSAPSISLRCLAANGEVLKNSKGVSNPKCAATTTLPKDDSDNARSITLLLNYGNFVFLDSGDLTWNIEAQLVCPTNLIGHVDLYQVAHHGMNISNNPVLLQSISPTVAIMNNGPRKGGHQDTVQRLGELPTLKGLYQVHRNVATTDKQNAPVKFIANLEEGEGDAANMIAVSVDQAGRTFTVINFRTGVIDIYHF